MDHATLIQAGFRYALALRADRAQAEDLVQDAWLRLQGRLFVPMTKAALFKTIRNLFIDQYRRDSLIAFESLPDDDALDALSHENAAAFHGGGEDPRLDGIEQALDTLRPAEREALFLNAVEEYTADEIARMWKCPRSSVLSLIHRARLKLKKALAEPQITATNHPKVSHGSR